MKLNSNVILPQPDPFVCPVEGGWAMYATGVGGIGAYFCDTPFGKWEYRGIVLKMDGYHEYWAPCMHYADGWYYLYFSCMPVGAEVAQEHLRVAKAPTPFGPFENVKCLYDDFSIDAHVVRTDAGLYLWYAMDNTDCERVGTRIVVDKLLDPVTPAGNPLEKVIPSFDEEIYKRDRYKPGQHWHTIEGPFWLQVGDWQYVMYSGACFENDTYHIGYACAKTTEPDLTKVIYEKHTDHGKFVPLMTKNEAEEGVGHHSVIYYEGQYYAVYHARDYSPDPQLTVDQRTARICKLHFNDGIITAEECEKMLKREDIRIRDPFILPYEGKYYLYGTGTPGAENIDLGRQFWCYISEDLENWSDPICCFDAPDDFWGEKNFWAPEVHIYHGKFYLFGTFMAEGKNRATQALVADKPEGPYRVFGEPLTPAEWMCLDGTLYMENEKPYLVFCHEWLQVGDGEIAVIPLKEDLSAPDGEATVLFKASSSGWAEEITPGNRRGIVTDGPWLVKEDGKLLMFWSSFHKGEYAVGMAESETGSVYGPWKHLPDLLFEKNGGHGMMFTGFGGKRYFTLHSPNNHPLERANFYEVTKEEGRFELK